MDNDNNSIYYVLNRNIDCNNICRKIDQNIKKLDKNKQYCMIITFNPIKDHHIDTKKLDNKQ